MNNKPLNSLQLAICSWAGPVFIITAMIGWALTGMLPPVGPAADAETVAQFYRDNSMNMRIGLIILLCCCASFPFFMAGVIEQMKRMHTPSPLMIRVFSLFCGGLTFGLFVAMVLWGTAAFRPERAPELVQLLNDFSFLLFLWPGTFTPISYIAIALAVFADTNDEAKNRVSTFPRWFAFYNLWSAMLAGVACVIIFFKTGPFAFDGFYGFWINMIVFFLWYLVMAVLLLQSIKKPSSQRTDEPKRDNLYGTS